jgi:hypothetical protein
MKIQLVPIEAIAPPASGVSPEVTAKIGVKT